MKILAIGKDKPGTKDNDFKPYLKNEAQAVYDLYKEGIVREMYFCHERASAILMLECESKDTAKGISNQLPLVQKDLIHFDLFPLTNYHGFERLFV